MCSVYRMLRTNVFPFSTCLEQTQFFTKNCLMSDASILAPCRLAVLLCFFPNIHDQEISKARTKGQNGECPMHDDPVSDDSDPPAIPAPRNRTMFYQSRH
jgi:hypothetical protein